MLQREPEGDDTAPVDGSRDPFGGHAGRGGHLLEKRLLERVLGQPVVLEGPAAHGTDTEEARVLARAVVVQAAPVDSAALEVVLGRSGAGEELPGRRDLLGSRVVRRSRDRHVLVGEIVVGANEGKRLDRLGRRAHERDEAGIATRLGELSSGIQPDRVDRVPRLDQPSADDGYCERIHGRGA